MPHKHTRKGENKAADANLPPTTIARPLPVSKSAKSNGIFTSELSSSAPTKRSKKRKRNPDNQDDTPKAFQRLMAFSQGKRLPKGLDDGYDPTAKRKKTQKDGNGKNAAANAISESAAKEKGVPVSQIPTIRPGEKMSDFAARVDAALPVSGLINKSARDGKDPLGLKGPRTLKEKKMHRMYDEWRQQEKKIQERKADEADEAEEEALENGEGGVKWRVDMEFEKNKLGKGKKKGKKRKGAAAGEAVEVEDDDEDPWKALARKRNEQPRSLNDVVQAPPQFSTLPKEKFKVRGARVDVEDVPKAAGSLKRREELGAIRQSVVDSYRAMMKEKSTPAAE